MSCCGKIVQAIGEIKEWAYDGFILSAQYDKRIEICKACEFLSRRGACKKCGCVMMLKARMATANCPIGKWQNDA